MQVPYWLTYDFPPEVREKLKHQWGLDWKGQAQKCNRDESKEVSSKQKKAKRKVTAEATATTAETQDKKKKQVTELQAI
uniref:Uncharacterized protein n=1 Tax=Quercus lobata TaxID=97700 RepID=A0A7N2KY20_QUELO